MEYVVIGLAGGVLVLVAVLWTIRASRRFTKRRRAEQHTALPTAAPTTPAGAPQPVGPPHVGRFRLTARLGQGGMGTVYLGLTPGNRPVAVKVINPELASDPAFRRRFAREIETARRVGGFHTAPVIDADPQGNPPWLASEYIPGPSLHDVLDRHGAVPVRTLHTLAAGIAEALAEIHGCGVVHRDLKPSNVIVSVTGPRVIDFGIAQVVGATRLTSTGLVVGTPGFLAPEQLVGAPTTTATDLYAYAMVLCHAAGVAPFPDGASLESALGVLPAQLADVITRCLDHDPTRRPAATEVVRQLSSRTAPTDDWLPPPVRTMLDAHRLPTV